MDALQRALQGCDCVCLDFDSTVVTTETIDQLAAHHGVAEAVHEITETAMHGNMPFEKSLALRLSLIKPSLDSLAAFSRDTSIILCDGVSQFVEACQKNGVDVWVVSGGFTAIVEPVAAQIGIMPERVVCNVLQFDTDGAYAGFDDTRPTSRSGGKAVAVGEIIRATGAEKVVMIGDGATDAEAKPPASSFICFTGVRRRDMVVERSDAHADSWGELLSAFDAARSFESSCV